MKRFRTVNVWKPFIQQIFIQNILAIVNIQTYGAEKLSGKLSKAYCHSIFALRKQYLYIELAVLTVLYIEHQMITKISNDFQSFHWSEINQLIVVQSA